VDDTAVARALPKRTVRSSPLGSSAAGGAIPRPMMAAASGNGTPTLRGVIVPASPTAGKPFKADNSEGKSPTLLATDPTGPPDDEELELERTKTQEEDKKVHSTDREVDIYAVLACSIENPEACEMCSG